MCGFSFLLDVNKKLNKSAVIESMTTAIQHRGPDDCGYEVFDKVAFGFRRLSILDVSASGHQPMWSGCNKYLIVFNGEIFNYLELKKELADLGVVFRSGTDTEVLLNAYIHWGKQCVNKLNGMFSFLIYDIHSNNIFGARDRFGIKPLYMFAGKDALFLGSEIKSIFASGQVKKEVNWGVASDYLLYGQLEESNDTFYSGVRKVPPATAFSIDVNNGEMQSWKYWELTKKNVSLDTIETDYFDMFSDSVKLRMRSDVPVGVFLSGGMDSTAIVCEMRRQMESQGVSSHIHAYSFSSKKYDESQYIASTLRQTGANIQYQSSSASELWSLLDGALAAHDEPLHSMTGLVGYSLMKMAKKDGTKVILNGQGADEVLAGYPSYFNNYWHSLLRSGRLAFLKSEIDTFAKAYNKNPTTLLVDCFKKMMKDSLRKLAFYRQFSLKRKQKSLLQDAWFSGDFKAQHLPQSADIPEQTLDGVLRHSIEKGPLPLYLRIEDRNSMASSVEARLPFMDYRLVELGYSSPDDLKMAGQLNKYLLRQSMTNKIPDLVRNRVDKMGFPTPVDEWVRGDLYDVFAETIQSSNLAQSGIYNQDTLLIQLSLHRQGKINCGARLFRVVQFEKWVAQNF